MRSCGLGSFVGREHGLSDGGFQSIDTCILYPQLKARHEMLPMASMALRIWIASTRLSMSADNTVV